MHIQIREYFLSSRLRKKQTPRPNDNKIPYRICDPNNESSRISIAVWLAKEN